MPPTSTTSSISSVDELRVLERLPADVDGALDEIAHRASRASRAVSVRCRWSASFWPARDDEGEVDLGLVQRRELALGLLGAVAQALEGHAILAEVDVVLVLEAACTSQSMTRASKSSPPRKVSPAVAMTLKMPAFADLEDRDVEGAAAEVVDGDGLLDVACRSRRRAPPPWAR